MRRREQPRFTLIVVAEAFLGVLFSRGLTDGKLTIITISLVKADVVIAGETVLLIESDRNARFNDC